MARTVVSNPVGMQWAGLSGENKRLASLVLLMLKRQSKKMASFLFSTESVVRSRAAKTLRDPQGPKIDFRNTIISLTSNLGADFLLTIWGRRSPSKAKKAVMDVVQASYPPEFLNRVNEFIISKRLSRSAPKIMLISDSKSYSQDLMNDAWLDGE